jgi:cobalt-zinc-cadmium resistance protein CzcA
LGLRKYKKSAVWRFGIISFGRLFTMGGEFIPTLDERFCHSAGFKTGTSLTKLLLLLQNRKIILKNFPEVDQVVSRIGAAEVPDPMSMEESDVCKLKPKSEWVSADSKDELADKIKAAIEKDSKYGN